MSVQELQELISPRFTEQLLKGMVEKWSGFTDVVLTKIKLGAASKKGDSYLSTICRFSIEAEGIKDGTKKSISVPVIVKFFPKNVARVKTYRSADFFENEFIFFEKVWSAYNKFQEDEQITNKFDNIPTVLSAHCDGKNDYIAMYDLSFDNFTSVDRGNGLDYDHTVSFLQILAQFHALGLAFKEKNPEAFEAAASSLKETYFAEKFRPWYSNFQKRLYNIVRDAVEKELPPQYLTKFENLIAGDFYAVLVKSCASRGPLSVVTHGDVWVPNFLVKFKGSTSEKIVMIDFQLTRYASIATDLGFFLFSCAQLDLVESKWDDLISQYHQALNESLKRYGAKNLVTLEALNHEILEHIRFGIGMSMEALTMAQLDDDDVSDLDAIQGDQAVPLESVWTVKPFKEQEKRKRIATMIRIVADKNFI